MRNLEEDKAKITEYWDMDCLDDGDQIADILTIADSSIRRAIVAEAKVEEMQKALQEAIEDIQGGHPNWAIETLQKALKGETQ